MRSSGIREAILAVVVFTVLSKVVFFAQEVVTAALFGASSQIDAVVTSRLVPSFFGGMIGNALALGMIPLAREVCDTHGRSELLPLVHRILGALVIVFIVLGVLLNGFGHGIVGVMAPGYDPETTRLTSFLLLPGCMVAFIECVALLLVSLVHAELRFMQAGFAAVANGITSVVLILLLGPKLGAFGVVIAAGIGGIVQCLVLAASVPWLWRIGVRRTPGSVAPWARVIAVSGPAVVVGALTSAIAFVDRGIASTLGEGSVAVISWSQKLMNLPIGLLALPMASAVYPFLTRSSDEPRKGDTASSSTLTTAFLLVPCALVLVAAAGPIVDLLFRRGAFSGGDARRTAEVLRFYGAALVFMGTLQVLSRVAYAGQARWTPALGAVCILATYLPLGIWLSQILGLRGLALAYAMANGIGCLVVAAHLSVSGIWSDVSKWIRDLVGMIGAGALTAVTLITVKVSFQWMDPAATGPVVPLIVTGVVVAVVYSLGCWLFSVSVHQQIVAEVRSSFGRRS